MNRMLVIVTTVITLLGCGSSGPPDSNVVDYITGFDKPRDFNNLNVVDYIVGLDKPWDVKWTPEGQMLFTENNTGDVWVAEGNSAVSIHKVSDFTSSGEGGLMGLALSPNFNTDRYVFLCYTSDVPDIRIVRYQTDEGISGLFNKTPIVTGGPYTTGRHSVCRIKFGPDGYLWGTFGDAAIGTTPQDVNSLGGKILRVDMDGNAAPDNPGGDVWFARG